jgi:Glyoxalase-like domain
VSQRELVNTGAQRGSVCYHLCALLDHLVYAAPDLDLATVDLERRLGVRPGYGGKHAGGLTHNALLSLGEGTYLEIIAPVPGGGASASVLPFGLGALTTARLAAWAAAADDLKRRVAAARVAGYDPGEIMDGGRDLPDGGHLGWRLAVRPQPAGDGLVPFLIQWTSGPHPSATAPKGCRFVTLKAEHPEPESVLAMLRALAVDLPVTAGAGPRLIATLETPNGRVELS